MSVRSFSSGLGYSVIDRENIAPIETKSKEVSLFFKIFRDVKSNQLSSQNKHSNRISNKKVFPLSNASNIENSRAMEIEYSSPKEFFGQELIGNSFIERLGDLCEGPSRLPGTSGMKKMYRDKHDWKGISYSCWVVSNSDRVEDEKLYFDIKIANYVSFGKSHETKEKLDIIDKHFSHKGGDTQCVYLKVWDNQNNQGLSMRDEEASLIARYDLKGGEFEKCFVVQAKETKNFDRKSLFRLIGGFSRAMNPGDCVTADFSYDLERLRKRKRKLTHQRISKRLEKKRKV